MIDVLVVGSGGREHALAWKLRQSAGVGKLYCAPGNAGTASLAENVPIEATAIAALVDFCTANGVGFAVIGPEVPLSMGLTDALEAAGIQAFGPSKDAALLEGSKVFAKGFMARHGIPTGAYDTFHTGDAAKAKAFARTLQGPWVIKADGLAAGKGVLICATLDEADEAIDLILDKRAFGDAGDALLIEEYLDGEELSLMAFSDGRTVVPMATSQDHKRIFDGDQGPNTGGMGAYAPAPVGTDELVSLAEDTILKPVIAGMAAEGRLFKGVLYAGLMLTAQGPKVLEFNARFGDPETEVVLPLLDSDLLDILQACVAGTLDRTPILWKSGSCATVVLASAGYPGPIRAGEAIHGLDSVPDGVIPFHCGTAMDDGGQVVTAGGRVLSLTALGSALPEAVSLAYQGVEAVHFAGCQYRKDIAQRAL